MILQIKKQIIREGNHANMETGSINSSEVCT